MPQNQLLYVIGAIIILALLLYLSSFKNKVAPHNLKVIDKMNGLDFEHYVGAILVKLGYYNVVVTKGSGDFGVDITCYNRSKKYVFQVKRYSNTVGVAAIQQIVAGREFYKAQKAVAITNSYFTKAAILYTII